MASPPSPHKEERAILEAIRQGKAPTIVKRQASRGTLPVDAEEMVEILVFLTHDPDPTCSGTARKTLAGWAPEEIAATRPPPPAPPPPRAAGRPGSRGPAGRRRKSRPRSPSPKPRPKPWPTSPSRRTCRRLS